MREKINIYFEEILFFFVGCIVLGKSVSASSMINPSYPPVHAINNYYDTGNKWISAYSDYAPWFHVNLLQAYNIYQIEIVPGTYHPGKQALKVDQMILKCF